MLDVIREDSKKNLVNKVYRTEDLSIFKFTKFNRNVAIRREMLEQAKEGFINPIIVNEHMIVIDGQHRIEHAKRVGVPVEYIIKPGLDEHDIVRMNTTQKPWSLLNYIESYANQGLEEYVSLLNLVNEKFAGTTDVVSISMDKTFWGEKIAKDVKEGNFKFFNFQKTLNFLKYYEHFRNETNTPKRSKVVAAIYELYRLEGFDGERLIQKVNQKKFDEDLRVKGYTFVEALHELIDKYNDRLTENSPQYIDFYVNSKGELHITNDRQSWTTKKTAQKGLSENE